MPVILSLYDFLRARRGLCLTVLLLLTAVLAVLMSRQRYKEDIADFLPLDSKYGQALRTYQESAGANRIVALFASADSTLSDPDRLVEAVEAFAAIVAERDTTGLAETVVTQIDLSQAEQTVQFLYDNMPYFLTDGDYARMDSLLADDTFIDRQLAADKQSLMLPMGGMMAGSVQRDPLGLFTPLLATLRERQPAVNYENYDGYIFTPDMSRALVLMQSPYGGSESSRNACLLRFLEDCAAAVDVAGVDIRFAGGPVIAVENAQQIKRDSLLAVTLALLLIVGLLCFVFRSVRNLVLIVVSIGWGWLFAMAALAAIHDSVSVIVIGISSVIVGIAVNYPLHLIAHLRHTPDVRRALREIAAPLVVGNITTVGAFLALVPLESVALRDLGLFSSLLLVGTILFVLVFLPQLRPSPRPLPAGRGVYTSTADKSNGNGNYSPPSQGGAGGGPFGPKGFVWPLAILVLTLNFGYFSLDTTFDSNIANINYMSAQQRQDMERLASLKPQVEQTGDSIYRRFLCPEQEQRRRLRLWDDFTTRHGQTLEDGIRRAATAEGFADGTFDDFLLLLHRRYEPRPLEHFAPLLSTVFAQDQIVIADGEVVDVRAINSMIVTRLSDDFNYIGWACGLIVFLFLWFSLGSLELAVLSFLPMAVSWVWILGLMSLFDIHFNLVNIILATFIFGQGDDYTIFMTEGCQYEYAYRRPMLASYKQSIVLSALIMFVGIGALIFAQHPALRSLAQVTIVGMFSVVLMAWLLPPLLFRWLVTDGRGYRRRPLSLSLLWHRLRGELPGTDSYLRHLVYDRYRYKGWAISREVARSLRQSSVANLQSPNSLAVINSGYGELPLLLALQHPGATVYALEADGEKLDVARHSAEGLAPNIVFIETTGQEQIAQLQAETPDLQIIRL